MTWGSDTANGCLNPKSIFELMIAKDGESSAVKTFNLDLKEADFPKIGGKIGQMSRSDTLK